MENEHTMNTRLLSSCAFLFVFSAGTLWANPLPKTLAYHASPTPYLDDHAEEVAKLYDGFFFTIGTWEEGIPANLGLSPESPASTNFQEAVRTNLTHLRKAGATESLLGVCFSRFRRVAFLGNASVGGGTPRRWRRISAGLAKAPAILASAV